MALIIPPFTLLPKPLNDEARKLPKFKWAGKEIGNRHKLGGFPDFIQQTSIPSCPDCGEEMVFYAQLDSINDQYCIADCGMIYVFVCLDCNNVHAMIQSY